MKKCSNCNIKKKNKEFSKANNRKDGLQANCKSCFAIRHKERILTDTYRLRIKKYYIKNKTNLIKGINERTRNRDDGLYFKYWAMKRRCKYKSQDSYKYYKKKGIKVVWKSYIDFKNDMYESYKNHLKKYGHKQTTLDRIDNSKNYCKENCRWATWKEQIHNRSIN